MPRKKQELPRDPTIRVAFIFFGTMILLSLGSGLALVLTGTAYKAPTERYIAAEQRRGEQGPLRISWPDIPWPVRSQDLEIRNDLDAQIEMARSARYTANIALWQLIIAALGTIALLYTLRETRRSASAAIQAVAHQRQIERGRIDVLELTISPNEGRSIKKYGKEVQIILIELNTTLLNIGQTWIEILSINYSNIAFMENNILFNREHDQIDLPISRLGGEKEFPLIFATEIEIGREIFSDMAKLGFSIQSRVTIEYEDVFSEKHTDDFSFSVKHARFGERFGASKISLDRLEHSRLHPLLR